PLAGCGKESGPLVATSQTVQLSGVDLAHVRQLIADYGCVACHTVPGVKGPTVMVGPPLENLARRGYLGGVLPNTPDNLVRWLLNPPSIDPQTAMPDTRLSNEDGKDIAAYLVGFD